MKKRGDVGRSKLLGKQRMYRSGVGIRQHKAKQGNARRPSILGLLPDMREKEYWANHIIYPVM